MELMLRQQGHQRRATRVVHGGGYLLVLCLAYLLVYTAPTHAGVLGKLFGNDRPLEVQVADPYIEMHSGAGRGYPILQVEERGAWISILKRKTDWFKVRTERGREGWVAREQLERTLTPTGDKLTIAQATQKEFSSHRLEIGALGGTFEGAETITLYGGVFLTPKLSLELSASKIFPAFSSGEMADISINMHPFPSWRFSPFFTLGTGLIRSNPNTTLVQQPDRVDQLAHVGLGVNVYLARRFVFRAQYKNYLIFQSTDDNQEINEWKAGFAVFF